MEPEAPQKSTWVAAKSLAVGFKWQLGHRVAAETSASDEPLLSSVRGLCLQWLVLRDDGFITAADYAQQAAEATAADRAVGSGEFWDMFDRRRALTRREAFIRKVLRGVFSGLAFMHERGRLHQSLGPASIALK